MPRPGSWAPQRRGNPHPGRALAGAGKLCGRGRRLGHPGGHLPGAAGELLRGHPGGGRHPGTGGHCGVPGQGLFGHGRPGPGEGGTGSPASPPRCRNSPRIAWCFPWLPVKCRPALCLPCRWWTAPPSPMRSWPACAWALAPACPSPICRRPSCPLPWLGRTAGP